MGKVGKLGRAIGHGWFRAKDIIVSVWARFLVSFRTVRHGSIKMKWRGFQKPEPSPERTNARAIPVEHSTIGKNLVVKGDISGTDSLFIDGTVEGSVNLPSGCVTVGFKGRVEAAMNASKNLCITAREIVIIGSVRGNAWADHVEIRAKGKLTGNLSTSSISIADGSFFKGNIDVRNAEVKGEESGAVPMQLPPTNTKVIQLDRNRRSAVRYKLRLPIIFHWNEDGERTGFGFTSDVALDGALINSSECPPVGSDVRIEVRILSPVQDGQEMRIQCVGKVTRIVEQGGLMSFGVRGDFHDDHLPHRGLPERRILP